MVCQTSSEPACVLTEITGYLSLPLISPERRAAAPGAQGPRCACHSPRGEGRLASPLHSCPASGGSRGLQRVLRKAGGRKTPQPYPKSPGLGPGPRPLLSAAVGARRPSSPAPDFAPRLSPRPRLSPCGGRAASSAAARLWVAQRPTGPRTAGEARGRPSQKETEAELTKGQHAPREEQEGPGGCSVDCGGGRKGRPRGSRAQSVHALGAP